MPDTSQDTPPPGDPPDLPTTDPSPSQDVEMQGESLPSDLPPRPQEMPVPNADNNEEFIIEYEECNPVPNKHDIMEVSIEERPEDISENSLYLYEVLENYFTVQISSKQRRI